MRSNSLKTTQRSTARRKSIGSCSRRAPSLDLSTCPKKPKMIVVGCRGRGPLHQRLPGLGQFRTGSYARIARLLVIDDEDPHRSPIPRRRRRRWGLTARRHWNLAMVYRFQCKGAVSRRRAEVSGAGTRGRRLVYQSIPVPIGRPWNPPQTRLLAERLAGWQKALSGRGAYAGSSWVINRPGRLSSSLSLRSSLWSAVTAAAGSPECCWARSARRWCSQRVCP